MLPSGWCAYAFRDCVRDHVAIRMWWLMPWHRVVRGSVDTPPELVCPLPSQALCLAVVCQQPRSSSYFRSLCCTSSGSQCIIAAWT